MAASNDKSQGATTARTRANESSLVPSLFFHGHYGNLEEMKITKTHTGANKKIEKLKEKAKREIGNPPKPKKNRKQETNQKSDPRKFRSSARKRRLGIAGIGVIGRCALTIMGPFEVSYIPPCMLLSH